MAIDAVELSSGRPSGPLPARLMIGGTSGTAAATQTEIITAESVDRKGKPIPVGDTIVEADGSVLSTRGVSGAGRVLAVAGSAVIYSLGEGKGYSTAQAGECYVVAAANERGGASPSSTPTPASNEGVARDIGVMREAAQLQTMPARADDVDRQVNAISATISTRATRPRARGSPTGTKTRRRSRASSTRFRERSSRWRRRGSVSMNSLPERPDLASKFTPAAIAPAAA